MVSVNDYSIYVTRIRTLLKDLEEDFLHADTNPKRYERAYSKMPIFQACIDKLELIAFKNIK